MVIVFSNKNLLTDFLVGWLVGCSLFIIMLALMEIIAYFFCALAKPIFNLSSFKTFSEASVPCGT